MNGPSSQLESAVIDFIQRRDTSQDCSVGTAVPCCVESSASILLYVFCGFGGGKHVTLSIHVEGGHVAQVFNLQSHFNVVTTCRCRCWSSFSSVRAEAPEVISANGLDARMDRNLPAFI